MRIFNKEKNQLVAYVQRKNIKAIIKYEDKAPKGIYQLAKDLKLSDMDETHDEEFVRITNKKDIEFLKQMHWIPDYRELKDLSDEELTAMVAKKKEKLSELQALFLTQGPYEQRKNPYLQLEYSKINQTIKDINAYLWTRQGKYPTPITIPLMIDALNGIIESNNLRVGLSVDGQHILVENKNGARPTSINPFELQPAIMILATECNLHQQQSGEFKIDVHTEPTNRFLVADFEFEAAKEKTQVQEAPTHEEPTRLETKQKRKSFFQRVFQPKQKDEN